MKEAHDIPAMGTYDTPGGLSRGGGDRQLRSGLFRSKVRLGIVKVQREEGYDEGKAGGAVLSLDSVRVDEIATKASN